GTFAYTATVYLATLAMMAELARTADPASVGRYEERRARCARRVDEALWDPRGYFRTTETHDSIFTAALAGDWIARLAGLPPVVDTERAVSHLRHQHRVLVDEAVRGAAGRWRPLPRAEARFDGTPIVHPMTATFPAGEDITYVWQVLSYQAMEQIYVGLVEDGLATMRLVYDRIWHDGHAWSAGLRGNGESIYMTHPVAWAALNALTGAALDVPGRTLHLGPRTGGEIGTLRCPVFFPRFWAWLDWERASGRGTLEVTRVLGEPVSIERIVHRPARGAERVLDIGPTPFVAGRRLALDLPA
ncbi:MAG TPA: GH116 family glycosyl hydrolase, partial [Solirubrobacteraceae bacterium]